MSNESTSSPLPLTYFATPGRDTKDDFARKAAIVRNSTLLTAALDAIPGMVMILNQHRQIVAVNRAMVRVLEMASDDLLEKRLGEVIGCVRPRGRTRMDAGRVAIVSLAEPSMPSWKARRRTPRSSANAASSRNRPSGGGALDLRVAATPMEVDDERFILVAVDDISQPNRMAVLQRVFFHDVLNTAGCIAGYADYLAKEHAAVDEVSALLTYLSEQLIEEINAQRDLVLAEAGDLALQVDMLTTRRYWTTCGHNMARVPSLRSTDRSANGLERHRLDRPAAADADPGKHAQERFGGHARRWQRHDGLPRSRRAGGVCGHQSGCHARAGATADCFSDRSARKGSPAAAVGTYSMKLLGERYLGGQVDFVSQPPEGTTFTLTIRKSRP